MLVLIMGYIRGCINGIFNDLHVDEKHLWRGVTQDIYVLEYFGKPFLKIWGGSIPKY